MVTRPMYVVNKVQLIYYGPIHARPIIPPPSGAWGDHMLLASCVMRGPHPSSFVHRSALTLAFGTQHATVHSS